MTNIQDQLPFWESFPNLAPQSLPEQVGKRIPWHSDAASPRSSQTFCVSAFGCLIGNPNCDVICQRLGALVPLCGPTTDTKWEVHLEYTDRSLLNEFVGTATQIDVLLAGRNCAITIESKLVSDADAGLGTCSKYKNGDCKGYYGPGSDKKSPATWCVLERWDGKRTPRLYWTLGRSYFRPEVFRVQGPDVGDVCPLRGSHYQLMRNFLSAAAFAGRKKLRDFGTLVICPKAKSGTLASQVKAFKENILLPQFAEKVRLVFYDDYLAMLRESDDHHLKRTADFLHVRMNTETGTPRLVD